MIFLKRALILRANGTAVNVSAKHSASPTALIALTPSLRQPIQSATMQIKRQYTTAGERPYSSLAFAKVTSEVRDFNGEAVEFEAPES